MAAALLLVVSSTLEEEAVLFERLFDYQQPTKHASFNVSFVSLQESERQPKAGYQSEEPKCDQQIHAVP